MSEEAKKEVTAEAKVDEGNKEAPKLTPEQEREAAAQVLQITLYPDGQLKVESVKNITTRAVAEYIVSRAKEDYFKADVSNLTAMRLIDIISKGQKNKEKAGGLWTGGKK